MEKRLREQYLDAKNKGDQDLEQQLEALDPDKRRGLINSIIDDGDFPDYMRAMEHKERLRGNIGKGKKFETVEDFEAAFVSFMNISAKDEEQSEIGKLKDLNAIEEGYRKATEDMESIDENKRFYDREVPAKEKMKQRADEAQRLEDGIVLYIRQLCHDKGRKELQNKELMERIRKRYSNISDDEYRRIMVRARDEVVQDIDRKNQVFGREKVHEHYDGVRQQEGTKETIREVSGSDTESDGGVLSGDADGGEGV